MPRYLVAYYSWTGNTAKVARLLADGLSADIEQIKQAQPRSGPFAFASSACASLLQMSPAILPPVARAGGYDVVLLGCPVWAANMATPMRAYIQREHAAIRQVGLFCTLGGSGSKAAFAQMERLAGQASLASLSVDRSAFNSGTWRAMTQDFVQKILHANASSGGHRKAV